MNKSSRIVLNDQDIRKRIHRMAWQIYEELYVEEALVIAGIKENGLFLAELLAREIESICSLKTVVLGIGLDKKNPFEHPVNFEPSYPIENQNLIIVDDVLNTGRTLLAALIPAVTQKPKRVKTVVLANRDHKEFPVAADYVGISLATTLEEHITFTVHQNGKMEVALD